MTLIRIMCDQTDGTTIKLGAIETDKTGGTIYSARRYLTQEVRRTGDVKRLCLTVKTGERIDAMSCELIDPLSGGVK